MLSICFFVTIHTMNYKKGFTLIELLVVVAIIGVLASIVLSSLSSARASARDSRRLAEVRSLQSALELYYLDNGEYPQVSSDRVHNCTTSNGGWDELTLQLAEYGGQIMTADASWPYCTYYFDSPYLSNCDAELNPEYTIIIATEASTFSSLDSYNTQGENGSAGRYCIYPN